MREDLLFCRLKWCLCIFVVQICTDLPHRSVHTYSADLYRHILQICTDLSCRSVWANPADMYRSILQICKGSFCRLTSSSQNYSAYIFCRFIKSEKEVKSTFESNNNVHGKNDIIWILLYKMKMITFLKAILFTLKEGMLMFIYVVFNYLLHSFLAHALRG